MSDVIARVPVNDPSAAAANSAAISDAIAACREQGDYFVLPPGAIWVSQTIHLGEVEPDFALDGQGREAGEPSSAPISGPASGMSGLTAR
jgi:hypothetical protein